MEEPFILSLGSVFLVSLMSFAGLLTLLMGKVSLKRAIFVLVSLSVGVLFGDVFVHLLPEVYEGIDEPLSASLYIAAGILSFLVLEKFVRWGHAHDDDVRFKRQARHDKVLGSMVLVSDSLHNFIDGLIITAAFMGGTSVGIATTIAVVLHEIPQEIGNFGVLLHAGYSKAKALFYNFLSALAAFLGVAAVYFIGEFNEASVFAILSFSAGGFIYIAGSDLVPELHKEVSTKKSAIQLVSILAGFALMFALLYLE